MLGDVLALLTSQPGIDRVIVVTADEEAGAIASRHGADILREAEATGLNAAVRQGGAHAALLGAARLLFLPGDVPLATHDEIGDLLASPGLAIVPSRDGDGTNALLLSPPEALDPSFGSGSFARHRWQAEAAGLPIRIARLPGIGADIDGPADLDFLMRNSRSEARYAFLTAAHRPAPSPSEPAGACA
jgi:2-phospho-L-lactate guanylyltransferase